MSALPLQPRPRPAPTHLPRLGDLLAAVAPPSGLPNPSLPSAAPQKTQNNLLLDDPNLQLILRKQPTTRDDSDLSLWLSFCQRVTPLCDRSPRVLRKLMLKMEFLEVTGGTIILDDKAGFIEYAYVLLEGSIAIVPSSKKLSIDALRMMTVADTSTRPSADSSSHQPILISQVPLIRPRTKTLDFSQRIPPLKLFGDQAFLDSLSPYQYTRCLCASASSTLLRISNTDLAVIFEEEEKHRRRKKQNIDRLFDLAPPHIKQMLADSFEEYPVEWHKTIVRRGDIATHIRLVCQGTVALLRNTVVRRTQAQSPFEKEKVVRFKKTVKILGPDFVFGISESRSGRPFEYDVVSNDQDTAILAISSHRFWQIASKDQSVYLFAKAKAEEYKERTSCIRSEPIYQNLSINPEKKLPELKERQEIINRKISLTIKPLDLTNLEPPECLSSRSADRYQHILDLKQRSPLIKGASEEVEDSACFEDKIKNITRHSFFPNIDRKLYYATNIRQFHKERFSTSHFEEARSNVDLSSSTVNLSLDIKPMITSRKVLSHSKRKRGPESNPALESTTTRFAMTGRSLLTSIEPENKDLKQELIQRKDHPLTERPRVYPKHDHLETTDGIHRSNITSKHNPLNNRNRILRNRAREYLAALNKNVQEGNKQYVSIIIASKRPSFSRPFATRNHQSDRRSVSHDPSGSICSKDANISLLKQNSTSVQQSVRLGHASLLLQKVLKERFDRGKVD